MAIKLGELRDRLLAAVPAYQSIPDDAQAERAAMDAVSDYGERRPLEKLTALSIVSGTATYALPEDFLRVIRLERLDTADGVLITADGLVPTNASWQERYYVVGTQITFDPTPGYSMSRDLWYAARYVLENGEYADLDEAGARVALLKAQAIVLSLQATKAAQEAWSYAIGDEKVSKEKLSEALRKQGQEKEKEYQTALASQVGVWGIRADYDVLGR